MRRYLIIGCLITVWYFPFLEAQDLSFFKEFIEVTVSGIDTFSVRGVYHFQNKSDSDIQSSLLYPFPVDTALSFPSIITIRDDMLKRDVPFETMEHALAFQVRIPAKKTKSYTVSYKQCTKKRVAYYILHSTQTWNAPLRDARYRIKVARRLTPSYISYQCDRVYQTDIFYVFNFSKKNFMPDRDLIVTW